MSEIDRLKGIMARLRDPKTGCPWDIEQDFLSIAPHTIEEAYEVADAIDKGDMQGLKEELGDLMLQVIFHSQMADEKGYFCLEDVMEGISDKLIRRHPHVFGDEIIKTSDEQEESWEKQKEQERQAKSGGKASVLDGVAITLPALTRSVKLQKRAAKIGFDWPDLDGVFDKIEEELAELKAAIGGDGDIAEESGDLLFIISNLLRKLKVDPEVALKGCNNKFIKRFSYIEEHIDVKIASLEQMDELWNDAKKIEKRIFSKNT